jgi:outer membrane lipopolysaccharide assembly protein LptE/RlpB
MRMEMRKQLSVQFYEEWENSPESVKGEGIAAELIRTIRKIAQVQERLKKIEVEIEALKRSALYQLREKVIAAQQEGRDLLAEMAAQIDEEIAAAKVTARGIES